MFGCDDLGWNYLYNRLSVVSVCAASLVLLYSSEMDQIQSTVDKY